MRILLIGDIVGKPGRQIVVRALPGLIQRESLDLVIANAENAAAGTGLTPAIYEELISAGVDGITLGDHIYKRNEIIGTLESEENIVKPANYPPQAPGKDSMILTAKNGVRVGVVSLMGRVFMRPVDCPWAAADRVLSQLPADIKVIVVDFHAEATSDKQLLARYLDGRVSAVLGTHTHVPTADECVLPGGAAFQCDVGMTGPYDSVLGRRVDRVLETTITFNPTHFDVATGDVRLCGAMVDVDPQTGRALSIRRVRIDENEARSLAESLQRKAGPVVL
ncbi:MAG: TIGR00282 family metallophosphoesterase [Pirellulales bacterium]|nr:TIGR00282 family metallophosphoesterase [Pirellulales bacterium]